MALSLANAQRFARLAASVVELAETAKELLRTSVELGAQVGEIDALTAKMQG